MFIFFLCLKQFYKRWIIYLFLEGLEKIIYKTVWA